MESWCNLKYDDETIQKAIYVNGDKTKSKKIYEKKNPAHRSETITYTIDIDHKSSYRTTNKAPTDNGFCRFIFTGIDQNGNLFNTINESFHSPPSFTSYLKTNFNEKTLSTSQSESAIQAPATRPEAWGEIPGQNNNIASAVPPKPVPGTGQGITPAGLQKVRTGNPVRKTSNPITGFTTTIYFYGNYEPEGANNELSKPVDLASVLKLRIAEGNWIHYNYQSKENTGNLSRTAQITNKYPYLHLTLTPTEDGKWTVKGTIHPSINTSIKIEEGELPPKNKGGRVGGSKMGRSTVLGRIMSIIRGSIKQVTRKKGRKPRSKTRRYKNKSQKKEKNKLNITKKVRFNRNKI